MRPAARPSRHSPHDRRASAPRCIQASGGSEAPRRQPPPPNHPPPIPTGRMRPEPLWTHRSSGRRRWPGACLRLLLCLACLLARGCRGRPHSDVVVLTDENFDQKTSEGTWFVEIFAPWCSHCRKIEEVWQDLATRLKKEGINVGKIDGTRENTLTSRFEIQGYPSFFHLTQGECRQYEGGRSADEFYEFATNGWKRKEPWPFYRAPNSPVGRSLGVVKRWFSSVPSRLKKGYQLLHSDMGLSELWILVIALSVPVAIGLSCICVLDYINTRHSLIPDADVARPHVD